jgi:hypothetical protein
MFDGSPLLGFRHMVAPINKTPSSKKPLSSNCTGVGDVPKLPRDIDAASKVAPNLHIVLRKMLQSKEVQGEIIENFLEHSPSIKRYDSAFRVLWAILKNKGIDPPKSTLEQIASGLIELKCGKIWHVLGLYPNALEFDSNCTSGIKTFLFIQFN